MSDLVTTGIQQHALNIQEKNVLQTLPVSQQDLVHLKLERPINSYSPVQIKTFCLNIFSKACLETQSELPTNTILRFQTEALVKELSGKFGGLTVSEIEYAFSEGIRGAAGSYFGLCAQTYHKFLKWIFEHKEKAEAWSKYLTGLQQLKFSETPKQFTKEYLIRSAKRAFEEYKNDGRLPFFPHATYDIIKDILKVKTLIDKKDWQNVRDQAKKNLNTRHRSPKNQKSILEILNMESRTWEFEIKRIALKNFFNNLIANNKTLEL